ncbi:restriction endonuclease subunit S [Roseateles sp. LYH14W]|uniref:Restriction endonuclease subunit S n=1 Tax=Pelomonas parva TaxID=3299032 RepID=A0ABW7F2H9_9BURK
MNSPPTSASPRKDSSAETHSEWEVTALGKVVTLQRGFDITKALQSEGTYPVVSSSGIRSYHREAPVKGPGVVLGRKGTLGSVFYLAGDYWPHDTTLWVKDFHGNVPRFVYYYLQSLDLGAYDVGSSNPTLNRNHVHLLPARVPRPAAQQAIADLLAGLDDKVDLLRRQNRTLETMAETLFRQWFLEGAEDHWTEYSVGDFADHLKRGVQPGDQPAAAFLHFSLPAFDAGQRAVVEPGSQILSNKFEVPEGVLLVSKLNPRVSRVWPIDTLPEGPQAICSTEFQVLKPKKQAWFGYLYGLLTSSAARDALMMAASGTSGSHQRVRPEDILAIKTTLPSLDLAEQFSSWSEPVLSKRQRNIEQIAVLERTRDNLLPKLMSGEVRVAC